MNIEKSLKIMEMFKSSAADKLEYSKGDYTIKLEKSPSAKKNTGIVDKIPEEGLDKDKSGKQASVIIVSPFIGVFKDGTDKEGRPFVIAGDRVEEGQTVCLVEGVGGSEEVRAPEDGFIAAVHVANGESVEYGRGLFTLTLEGAWHE